MFLSTRPLGHSLAAASVLVVMALGPGPASSAGSGDAPRARGAQPACHISSMVMKSKYSARIRGRYIAFKPRIQCTRNKSWSITIAIRRRRSLGTDMTVASRSFRGKGGSRRFRLVAPCNSGNSFNGDVWLRLSGQPTKHVVRKNVGC